MIVKNLKFLFPFVNIDYGFILECCGIASFHNMQRNSCVSASFNGCPPALSISMGIMSEDAALPDSAVESLSLFL